MSRPVIPETRVNPMTLIPWDVLVDEIIPRLFVPQKVCSVDIDPMYDRFTAAELLERVVVDLVVGWFRETSGSLDEVVPQDDLRRAIDDVCRSLAYIWYPKSIQNGCQCTLRTGTDGYTGFKELLLDDNARGCSRVRWNGSPDRLLVAVNRYGSCVDGMRLCHVDRIDVLGRGSWSGVGLSITVSIECGTAWEQDARSGRAHVASIAVVTTTCGDTKTYGEVIQEVYRRGLYPECIRKKGRTLSFEERQRVRVCDVEARQVLDYPGFCMCDVMALFVSSRIVWLEHAEPLNHVGPWHGRRRARIEFSDPNVIDSLEEYFGSSTDDVQIMFTHGSHHPLVYHDIDACDVFHPCRLMPLEDIVRAKRNRVQGCSLENMNQWIPLPSI